MITLLKSPPAVAAASAVRAAKKTARLADQTPLLTRLCPICGPADATPEISSRPPAEEASLALIRGSWTGFFKQKVFFTYSRCASCGLLYNREYLAPAQISSLYGQMPENMSGVPVRLLEKTQRRYYEFFRRLAPDRGRYLEVGPDTGLFTQFVARESKYEDHLLFEPNRAVLGELAGRLHGRPHQVYNGLLDFDAVADGSVAAITMIHVLDHLLDPLDTLRKLRRKLSPGGLIMVVVHDESSLLARLLGWRWPAYCLQHPQIYRPDTSRALFERAGYRVVATEPTANYFPLAYLAQHLAYAWKLGRLPALLPSSLSLPLRLGNFITAAVAAD
jgi:SAM-dependent methyltransferase